MKLGKMFIISLQKLFAFSWKSKFRIFDIQISWHHQIPQHKTGNTFYWVAWEANSLLMKFGQFMSYYKRKIFIKKFYNNCDLKTSSRPFFAMILSTTSIRKWNFWINLLILDIQQQNYQNLSKSAGTCPQIPFHKKFFEN